MTSAGNEMKMIAFFLFTVLAILALATVLIMLSGCASPAMGQEPPPESNAYWYGDADADGDVDLADFAVFSSCFNGPNRPIPRVECTRLDFGQAGGPYMDGDIDLTDFAGFQHCYNGPNRMPPTDCWRVGPRLNDQIFVWPDPDTGDEISLEHAVQHGDSISS